MRLGKPSPFLRAFLSFPCWLGPALFCPCGTRPTNLIPQKTTAPDLLLAPDTNASFTLHEDDGVSNNCQQDAYLKTKNHMRDGEQTQICFIHSGNDEAAVESSHLDVVRREKSPFYVLLNDQLDLSGMELRYDIFCSLAAKERYRKLHDGDAAQPLAWFR